jgi:hypothetical protein
MKTVDFLRKHDACISGSRWALSISASMADVWDAMIEQNRYEWLLWTATRHGVFTESILRKLACRFVRETPLADGGTVWSLLTDERSRKAIEVAEAYVDGNATEAELAAAYSAACDAYSAADAAARDAAYTAACAAAHDAAYYAACTAAVARADASYAAWAAARAADDVARIAADAAYYAADAAADDAARADAYDAQIQMIAELGNPFKEGKIK